MGGSCVSLFRMAVNRSSERNLAEWPGASFSRWPVAKGLRLTDSSGRARVSVGQAQVARGYGDTFRGYGDNLLNAQSCLGRPAPDLNICFRLSEPMCYYHHSVSSKAAVRRLALRLLPAALARDRRARLLAPGARGCRKGMAMAPQAIEKIDSAPGPATARDRQETNPLGISLPSPGCAFAVLGTLGKLQKMAPKLLTNLSP